MPLVDSAYNSRAINVPPHLPVILKQFCKAAIRTQPYDLLKWSSAYFRALAEGIEPPMKLRLEYPLSGSISGLTLGFLKVLLRQFGDYNKIIPVESILQRWNDLCFDRKDLNLIMIIGKFRRKCQIKRFLAIAVGLLGASLFDTMIMICELFTLEPDGGSGMIPITLFMELYGYLAGLRCDGSKRDSSEDDPNEFFSLDSSEPQTPSDLNKNHEPKAISLTSQDTDFDIELDNDNSNEISPKEVSIDIVCMKDHRLKIDNEIIMSDSEMRMEKSASNQQSCEEDNESRNNDKMLISTEKYKRKESKDMCRTRKKIRVPSELLTNYPNIPGIGPRLTPEQVATVAVWMTECARLQEGMVGPRNLRHFQCPSLDLQEPLS